MPAITKSRRKLEAWEDSRELDRVAIPLIPQYGVEEAYRMAMDEMETSGPASEPPCS